MLLYNRAFKNIHVVSDKDIYIDTPYKEYDVKMVSIDGRSTFSSEDVSSYNAEIIIKYHEKCEIKLPFSVKSLRKSHHKNVKQKLTNLGFTNITEQPIKDLTTGWIKKYGSTEFVMFNDQTGHKKGTIFKYDVPIVIVYHVFKKSIIYD